MFFLKHRILPGYSSI